MTRKQVIAKLNEALANINAAIESFNESGSMCEVTFDSLHNAKRNVELEIAGMHAPRAKVNSNTLELVHANCD